ncbi:MULTISPECIES: RNHCP domain-containing protein [Streptococcus]|uniref:RNHCP domain-containing protein n=1 Tax=Streptococcus gallolyticus TaxID=315405 RepID=A0A1I7GSS5_9STRE|nr:MULTISPECIES: RNHCP domain-containing protein [Streptococcus]MCR5052984.1 RNHCP domain-containing protein [Streptococcus sp.]MCY7184344.1 RNHCP domain-containing protein [Streptococcus gallolyticus subsp. gallolyticus]MCY7190092.1 RNHCP domain-containing protein [Streptococcus gallolyticus subsp. gallolyticus]SFC43993.1 RNHCP domain-containing protein [Streptococcus gallolyticus]SFU51513.1 RNHCP domain-containing protein [Streptococcus gallolyticus]
MASKREKKRRKYDKHYFKKHPCLDPFKCLHCGWYVMPDNAGTGHRNHCPNCLSSKHVDEMPGDREAKCGGQMKAIAVWTRSDKEWAIIHRCEQCGKLSSNRIAADDNPMKLMALAMKPFASQRLRQENIKNMITSMERLNHF